MVEKKIREARKEARLSVKQLASIVGVSDAAIYHWESGRYAPDYDSLQLIANACHVPMAFFFGGTLLEAQAIFNASSPEKEEEPGPLPPIRQELSSLRQTLVDLDLSKDKHFIPLHTGLRASPDGGCISIVSGEYILVEDRLKNCCAVRVDGDSMVEAGIMPGDYVIFSRDIEVQTGDTAILAHEHEEYIVKKIWRKNGSILIGARREDAWDLPPGWVICGRVMEVRRMF